MTKPQTATVQDMDLILAHNRIKKFQVKSLKDLKAGYYIDIRVSLYYIDIYSTVIKLCGKPNKRNIFNSLRFDHAYRISDLKSNDSYRAVYFSDYLLGSNNLFKYNSKVKDFVKLLRIKSAFQCYCIFNNKPYNKKTHRDFIAARKLSLAVFD